MSSIPATMASLVCSGLAFALIAMIGNLLQPMLSSSVLLKLQVLEFVLLLPLDSLGLGLRLPSMSLVMKLLRLSHSRIFLAAVRPSMMGISTSIRMQSIWMVWDGSVRKSRASWPLLATCTS